MEDPAASGRSPGASPGLSGRLRRLLGTGVALLQIRLDLLALELEEEKRRAADALLAAALGLLLLGIGLLLAIAGIVWLMPPTWRLPVLGLLAVAFLIAGTLLLRQARRRVSSPEGPAPATRAELRHDRAVLTDP